MRIRPKKPEIDTEEPKTIDVDDVTFSVTKKHNWNDIIKDSFNIEIDVLDNIKPLNHDINAVANSAVAVTHCYYVNPDKKGWAFKDFEPNH